jgi:hypothetical protein
MYALWFAAVTAGSSPCLVQSFNYLLARPRCLTCNIEPE